ncbi:MAG: hypothetical protein K2N18_06165, partial [Clostridia bacterium]|nr:hypothetical protein [Clostridia bacterium]
VSKLKALRVFLIVLTVLGFIAAVVSIFIFLQGYSLAGGITLGAGLAMPAICLPIIFCVIKKRIAEETERHDAHAEQAKKYLDEANAQMRPLNALFESDMTKRLIEQTVPKIKIDERFDMRRYDYLSGKYGFGKVDDNTRSTVAVLTGEILGNPYILHRQLVRTMGTYTYYGSIVIHWTTTYTDSEGKTRTEHPSQTLTASVTTPQPYYSYKTELVYGNEAAPDLNFSRSATHAERLSEKALAKKIKAGEKEIRKKQAKAGKSGGSNFTEMGNSEFDVLFGALDRDHEVQFRLMFTPLAQKNELALIKDKTYYGDDFSFRKRGCLNYISSEHAAGFDFDTSYTRYASYDVDIAKSNFLSFNRTFFRSLYFDLAPLISVPLYQQHKPKEYIYGKSYGRNYTDFETEYVVNRLGEEHFASPESATQSILKADFVEKDGKSDKADVTAYSFRAEDRLDIIPMLG